MNCPSCGTEVSAGSIMCPVCGEPVVSQPAMSYGAPAPSAPEYVPLAPARKKSPFAGVVITLAIVAAVLIAAFFVFGGRYSGTYELDSVVIEASDASQTVSKEELALYGLYDVSIKVSFTRCKFTGLDEFGLTGPYKFKISGDNVKITGSNDSINGSYDKDDRTIAISDEENGMKVTFYFKK